MIWECAEGIFDEALGGGRTLSDGSFTHITTRSSAPTIETTLNGATDYEALIPIANGLEAWFTYKDGYVARDLTLPSEKLPAVAESHRLRKFSCKKM